MGVINKKLFALDQVPEMTADYLAAIIEAAIAKKGHCHCALSGGSSPKAMLSALARKQLPWHQVTVLLVDERWSNDPSQQNITMMRAFANETGAESVHLLSLLTESDYASNLDHCETVAQNLPEHLDLIVLGMGLDGHTASLFPDAPEFHEAMTSKRRYVEVTPAAAPHRRISMSFNWIAKADTLALYIPGRDKLDCFNQIVDSGESDSPIRELVLQVPEKLTVFSSED